MSMRLAGEERDFIIPIAKSPKHIAMISLCPKKRKRGDHVVVHLLLKHLDIPAETDEQVEFDSKLLIANILELEMKLLLEQVRSAIPTMRRGLLGE